MLAPESNLCTHSSWSRTSASLLFAGITCNWIIYQPQSAETRVYPTVRDVSGWLKTSSFRIAHHLLQEYPIWTMVKHSAMAGTGCIGALMSGDCRHVSARTSYSESNDSEAELRGFNHLVLKPRQYGTVWALCRLSNDGGPPPSSEPIN